MPYHNKPYYLLLGAFYLLFGLFLLFFPAASLRFLASAVGFILTMAGVLKLLFSFYVKRSFGHVSGGSVASGLLLLLLGLYAASRPDAVIALIPIFFGASLIIDSFGKFQVASWLRAVRATGAWAAFLYALLTALIGIIFLLDPFGAASVTVMVYGAALAANGICELLLAFRLR